MDASISDTDKYILDSIRKWVWSGFYSAEEVDSMIDDILEDDANEQLVRAAVTPEFEKKSAAEISWPAVTDCDRLDALVDVLDHRNILFIQNSGYTMSDGHQDAFEILSDQPGHRYIGYCFYHGQDMERAVDGGGLMIAFNDVAGDASQKFRIGQIVKEELDLAGFSTEWDGTPDQRIDLPTFDWKRRAAI